jgi:DNA-binding response OmpR family regulator
MFDNTVGVGVRCTDAALGQLPLVLDANARCIRGIEMTPLLSGEFSLLEFLGMRAGLWHTTQALSRHVYDRDDPGARQLVWKYTSMLRAKLNAGLPHLIENCRRRGYRCTIPIQVAGEPG